MADTDRTSGELNAREGGKLIADEVGTATVSGENLDSGNGVSQAGITITVSARLIDLFGVENVVISHVGDQGGVEIPLTECVGPDDKSKYTGTTTSNRGLSGFSLLPLVDVPPLFVARDLGCHTRGAGGLLSFKPGE